jgi:hypothetical protein
MTSVSTGLSLLRAVQGPRKCIKVCYPSPMREFEVGFLLGAASNATWDRSVSSNHLYGAVGDRIIAELTLLGAGRAQRRANSARNHS